MEKLRGFRAWASPSTTGQPCAEGWELWGSSVGRKSLASMYQEERLSRGPGTPFSGGSRVGCGPAGAASARSQPRGSLVAAALRPDSEAGRLVPPAVAAADGVDVGGGQGLPRAIWVSRVLPSPPRPGQPCPVAKCGLTPGSPGPGVQSVQTWENRDTGPQGDGTWHLCPRVPKVASPGVEIPASPTTSDPSQPQGHLSVGPLAQPSCAWALGRRLSQQPGSSHGSRDGKHRRGAHVSGSGGGECSREVKEGFLEEGRP